MLIYDVWLNDSPGSGTSAETTLHLSAATAKRNIFQRDSKQQLTFEQTDWMEGEQKYNECVIKVIASCVFDTIFILLIWSLESVFKQLNNLFLSVTSLCPRPGQKKKTEKKGIFFSFCLWVSVLYIVDQDENEKKQILVLRRK